MICVGGFMASTMSDHWSRKTVMQIGVVGTTFFTVDSGGANAEQLIIVRLLTGLAGGFAVSAPFPIAAEIALAAAFTVQPFIAFLLADNPLSFRLLALRVGWR